MALLLGGSSCRFVRTPFLVEQLNQTRPAGQAVPPVPLDQRVATLVEASLSDSYVDPQRVAGWMAAVAAEPGRFASLVRCLAAVRGADPGLCYRSLVLEASGMAGPGEPPTLWGLPRPAAAGDLWDLASPASGLELDAERFLSNLLEAAGAVAALETLRGRGQLPEADFRSGLEKGAQAAGAYVKARRWRRDMTRHSNALVVSGGAANGAFGAGVVWRLLDVLSSCRTSPSPQGCPEARIDLAVGTSTGALIGLVVDKFFTPGHEAGAKELLLQSYTCSVESDLYCVHDTWDWKLVDDVRGLVRFDGVRSRIEGQVTPEVWTNGLELVTMAVDFETGRLFAESDQDPADQGPPERRVEAVLASIVEPVLAEPVDGLAVPGGRRSGTFLDGGVRSGLPLLQAAQRGAERVLVIANSGIEPDAQKRPPHAFSILARTIDLLVTQPRVGELGQGELAAVARRMDEYNVCRERLAPVPAFAPAGVEPFCERRPLLPAVFKMAAPWGGPPYARQVASSWRTSWVFRPEKEIPTAEGYSFRPEVMRPLFLEGVRTFHARCGEILGLYEVRGRAAEAACAEAEEAVVTRAQSQFRPVEQCTEGKPRLRSCP